MSVYQYLLAQPADHVNSLLQSPWCALAVYQSLDPLSKQLVMRLLMLKGSVVAREFLEQWMRPHSRVREELTGCIHRLKQLHILGSPPPPPAPPGHTGPPPRRKGMDMNGQVETDEPLVMNTFFAASLQKALTATEETPWQAASERLPPLANPPLPAVVEAYAAHRWNCVLHFLVGTADAPVPEPKVIELLVSTHLLAPGASSDDEPLFDSAGNKLGSRGEVGDTPGAIDAATAAAQFGKSLAFDDIMALGGGSVHITRGGYEFLLKDTSLQLWTFVDEYLRTAPARGVPTTEILAFLFEIGFCKPRVGYALSALSDTQRALLDDFASFGLVYVPEEQDVSPPDELPAGDRERGLAKLAARRRQHAAAAKAAAVVVATPDGPTTARGDVKPRMSSDGLGAMTAEDGTGEGDGDSEAEAEARALEEAFCGFDYEDAFSCRRFFPTSLAVILTQPEGSSAATYAQMSQALARGAASSAGSSSSSSSAGGGGGPTSLAVIVEKNFKLYAYTTVDLHLALLALFAKIEVKLPNLIVATLTRRSVLAAMHKGISADQIRAFLRAHAHPAVTAQGLDVPENVVDQLFIWQAERHRVRYAGGALLSAFDSPEQFRGLLEYLLPRDGVLFADEDPEDTKLVIQERAFEDTKAWLKAQREGTLPELLAAQAASS